MYGIAFSAMGCQMQALIQQASGDARDVAPLLARVPTVFAQAEQRFSRFQTDSELMTLNQQRKLTVSEPLYQMLAHALASARLTDGWVTPTILPKLLARGYGTSFERQDFTGAQPVTVPTFSIADWQALRLDPILQQVTLGNDLTLDLGGFAKGLTALHVAKRLSQQGANTLIDAGGDIVIYPSQSQVFDPPKADIAPWQVDLPGVPDIDLALGNLVPVYCAEVAPGWYCTNQPITLALPNQPYMLATSGIDYRYWYQADRLQTHLVNPVDDQPTAVICASVLMALDNSQHDTHPSIQAFLQTSNTCNLAQTLSKLCCLLGVSASLAWLQHHVLASIGLSLVVNTPQGVVQWLNPTMQSFISNDHATAITACQ